MRIRSTLDSVLNASLIGVCAMGMLSTAAVAQDGCVDLRLIGAYGDAGVGAYDAVAAYHEGDAYMVHREHPLYVLDVVDLRDPANPVLAASHTVPVTGFSGYDAIAVHDDLVLLGGRSGELVVFDVAAGATRSVFVIGDEIQDICVHGGIVYIGVSGDEGVHDGGFEIIDLSNPSSPARLSSVRLQSSDEDGRINDIRIEGSALYVVHDRLGLMRYDVQDLKSPVLVGSYQLPGGGYAYVGLDGDVAYLGTSQGDIEGVLSLNVADSNAISLTGTSLGFVPLTDAPSVAIRGDLMVLGYGRDFETLLLDLGDRSFPDLVFGTRSLFGLPAFIDDDTLVLMNGHGLRVYDLSAGFSGDCLPFVPCDYNVDGRVDMFDWSRFIDSYVTGRVDADVNRDGAINRFDVSGFFLCYGEHMDR